MESMATKDDYRRNSFGDRFSDDLTEEILQYMVFADKIRLQCVSKRFARTVFNRQYRLIIKTRYELYDCN